MSAKDNNIKLDESAMSMNEDEHEKLLDETSLSVLNRLQCTKCNRLMAPDHRNLKAHCVSYHIPDAAALRCKFCEYTESWNHSYLGFHTFVFHGEQESDYTDDRAGMLAGVCKIVNECFPTFKLPPLDADGKTVQKGGRVLGPTDRIRSHCRLCKVRIKGLSYERRLFHAITQHPGDRPGLRCKYCPFTAVRSLKQIREHMAGSHPTEHIEDYVDQREEVKVSIYKDCYEIRDGDDNNNDHGNDIDQKANDKRRKRK